MERQDREPSSRTINGFAPVIWIILGLPARIGLVAEFANVHAIDAQLALSVQELLLPREASEANIFDELI